MRSLGATGLEQPRTVACEQRETDESRGRPETGRSVTNRVPHGEYPPFSCTGGAPGNRHAARRERYGGAPPQVGARTERMVFRMVRNACGADAARCVAGACRNRTYQGSIEPWLVLKTSRTTRPDPPP